MRAKRFFYVSVGVLALAVAFHLAATTAKGQGASFVKVSDVPPDGTDSSPTFSPDGSMIAFLRQIGGSGEIRLVNSSGGTSWLLAPIPPGWEFSGGSLEWSPRGDKLALLSGPLNERAIYTVDLVPPVPTQPTTWGRLKAERR